MDLNDAERYAAAALFTLALHSTHVETGVDRNGNALAESDIAWGCPSEELFDEYLLSEVPLRLPAELQDIFWGFDCMAPAGLAPRLYAWLKIPRKAWPGLLRMPDLAGSAGSAAAVAAFVALVRRYAAFLDPELAFTTGQVSRLQQHFTQPDYAAMDVAAAPQQQQQQQQHQPVRSSSAPTLTALQDDAKAARKRESSSSSGGGGGGEAECGEKLDSSSSRMSKPIDRCSVNSIKSLDDEWQRIVETATAGKAASTVDAVAAAAAHITAAAVAASRDSSQTGVPPTISSSSSSDLATSPQQQQQQQHVEQPEPAAVSTDQTHTHDATLAAATPPVNRHTSFAAADFHELHAAVDQLPKAADEGTVVPAATFTPAEQYTHTTSHKAVLAVFEIIGGCLCSNTQPFMEPLFAVATKEAQGAAAAAASKAKDNSSSSSCDKAAAAAWFAAGATDESADKSKSSSSPKEAAAAAAAANKTSAQQQPLQGLAAAQWYDARARVAVKRIAHWLRVPWPQVRAFEQMWAAQALSVDPSAQPKYSSSSRAMQYLKVGAAAVGGGALLAVTGGLAAPAIAAGLGAAVSLAHGGAAAAAAVAGFAGSSAGTAAVTGLFGAWGASVGGGSAGRLYGEVQEFGFLDIGQSIYTDGRPLAGYGDDDQAAGCETAAAAASSSDSSDAQATAAAAVVAGTQKSDTTNETREQQDGSQPVQQQQGGGFFARLFSSGAAGSSDGGSSSSDVDKQQTQQGNSKSPGDTSGAAQAEYQQVGVSTDDSSRSSSDPEQQQQQQQQPPQEVAAQRVLQALGSFSDIASDKQSTAAAAAAAAEQTVAAASPAAAVEQQSNSPGIAQEQHQQQQQRGLVSKLQRQSTREHPMQDEWEPDWAPAQQQPPQQRQYIETSKQRQGGTSSSKKSPASSNKDPGNDGTGLVSSAAASAAKPPPPQHPAAAAAGSSAAGASSGLGSWFTRKAASPPPAAAPVYVPLLPTPINPRHSADTRMALLIAVNGCCISCTEDYVRPWLGLPSRDCDRFALVWESQCLKELGGALVSFLAQQALTQVTQKTIQTFLYTGLVGALALPMTLTTALKVAFGSKWLVALRRAQAAGKMLAMQLVQCCHGGRPVTLIGCSMGSRLVFHCLLELSRLGMKGCVENVILLGAPLSCRPDRWCSVRSVVAGRLINGYSVNDWTLGLLYRVHSSNSLWLQAAGIGKVEVPGVENVNLSRLVSGHSDYLTAMDEILDVINLQDT